MNKLCTELALFTKQKFSFSYDCHVSESETNMANNV